MSEMVTCFACDGDGCIARKIGPTSNARAICDVEVEDCGLCHGKGEISRAEAERAYSYPYGGLPDMVRSSHR